MDERDRQKNRPSFRKVPQQQTERRRALEYLYFDNHDMMVQFKVSLRTLQRWRDEKMLPFKKVSGKIFYLASKVEEFMEGDTED